MTRSALDEVWAAVEGSSRCTRPGETSKSLPDRTPRPLTSHFPTFRCCCPPWSWMGVPHFLRLPRRAASVQDELRAVFTESDTDNSGDIDFELKVALNDMSAIRVQNDGRGGEEDAEPATPMSCRCRLKSSRKS